MQCALPQQLHHGAVLPLPRPATYGGQEGVRQSTFLGKEKETDRLFDMLTECQNTGCSRRERIVREPRGQILTQGSESTRCVKTTLFKTSVKLYRLPPPLQALLEPTLRCGSWAVCLTLTLCSPCHPRRLAKMER